MKQLLTLFSSIIVTVISIKRLLIADSFEELLFGVMITLIFGFFSIFLIFENKLKKVAIFNYIANFVDKNRQVLFYLAYVFALSLFEVLFYFFTPESALVSAVRIFLMFFFAIGIILILILLFRENRLRNRM